MGIERFAPFITKLPSGWSIRPFNEILSEPVRNGIYKSKEFHGSGTKMINMCELFGYDFISNQEMKRIDLNEKERQNFLVRDGDLLFARRSLVLEGSGKCSLIVNPIEETTFESSIIRARPDKAKIHPKFLFYLFTSPLGRAIVISIAARTAVSGIRGSELALLELPIPPLPCQYKIASILSTYDDLIENNTRRIRILEQMAQAIYYEWFSKVEKQSLPEGWNHLAITDVPCFRIISENIREFEGEKIYFATADVDETRITKPGIPYRYNNKPSRAQKSPIYNSVWFARMRDTYKVLVFTDGNRIFSERIILSSGFVGFEATVGWLGYLYFTINSPSFHEEKNRYCTGATQMSLTNEGLSKIRIIYPSEDIVFKFDKFASPVINLILTLQQQNNNLRRARDLLLPRLVSGEVGVEGIDIGELP